MADMSPMELQVIRGFVTEMIDKSSQLTSQQQADLIRRESARGVPPLRKAGGQTETRAYPRSANVNGHSITTTSQNVVIDGPFGSIVALYVDNPSLTADVILTGEGILTSAGVRVRAAHTRRLEFDTPTDTLGNRVARLSFALVASAIDATVNVYIEVE